MKFFKYQGTGNDFVLIDNRESEIQLTKKKINQLCDRRFGIGADGLILLQKHPDYDFEMIYYNADGNESSMCGNGGRCIIAFAKYLGIMNEKCTFLAIDGVHKGELKAGEISLKMAAVTTIETNADFCFLDTGSPHYVAFTDDIENCNIVEKGSAIRNNKRFKKEGTNVNFVEEKEGALRIKTYERGVENETLSCGTGATACAIVGNKLLGIASPITIKTEGGELKVSLEKTPNGYKNIWLTGAAKQVFNGVIDV